MFESYTNMTSATTRNRHIPRAKKLATRFAYTYKRHNIVQTFNASLWSDLACEVIEITHAHGIPFYSTTARHKTDFEACGLNLNHVLYMIGETTIALSSSVALTILGARFKPMCDEKWPTMHWLD